MLACAALAVGLNLATYHVDRDAGYNEFNPGVYAICEGWAVGVYKNSLSRTTVHGGKVWSWGPIDTEVGIATGYERAVTPFVIPSIKIKNVRASLLLPYEKHRGGVTFSVEW